MEVKKSNIKLRANPSRVIPRYFDISSIERRERIVSRILNMSESGIARQLNDVMDKFDQRHRNFKKILLDNFRRAEVSLNKNIDASENGRLLIGSYFTNEYSIQAAALFNPSIVAHFNQDGISEDELRFILSLRAAGEGHISSIEFREGKISSQGDIELLNEPEYASAAVKDRSKKYSLESLKSGLIGASNSELALINKLPQSFTDEELAGYKSEGQEYNSIDKLLDSNYASTFQENIPLSERVLFPLSKAESMGMEDARFVRYNADGRTIYYGTYTAYNGREIKSQLITTNDFLNFEISTMTGNAVKDKGFALFPRKIKGLFYITSRQDGENMYLMSSDNIEFWDDAKILRIPEEPWEFVQLGNCGSPLETEEGWLLLTHAVGPMRRYVISAVLLDTNDPSKVIGRLKTPLIEPDDHEREGYVPNVVYSCGSIIHNNNLIIPYAMADSACGFATINVTELINEMK